MSKTLLFHPLNIQEIIPSQLRPWKENPRINEKAVDVVIRSIELFGFNVPILCNSDKIIIAGHVRWKAALKLGLPKVPVIILNMNDKLRCAFAITENKTSEIADWDRVGLSVILENLKSEEIDIECLGFSEAELEAMLEPVSDFDWSEFEESLLNQEESGYVSIPLKVHRQVLKEVKDALYAFQKKHKINAKNKALVNGKVLLKLLEVNDG